jgi:NAD(P)-dependent dehydrogenase (short-subunit alcohol dehydrogenase family)
MTSYDRDRHLQLKDKVVVVTGGAGLLGAAVCSGIARDGGLPVIADVDIDRAEHLASEIRANGLTAHAVAMDITKGSQIDKVIVEVQERFGRVDAVVNNAYPRGKNFGRSVEMVEYKDFCESLSVHLGGYFLVSQKFAIAFRSQGFGNIVNISSIYGLVAPVFELYEGTSMTMPVEYAAIKAGVVNLTRYFAQYYLRDGIRCNAVAPGGVRDGQSEVFMSRYDAMCGKKGLLDALDVVGAVTFLLSEASRYMTGQMLTVDDGWSL